MDGLDGRPVKAKLLLARVAWSASAAGVAVESPGVLG